METVEPLAAVCELAYSVARDGVEATPPLDPPAPMRSYLYVAQLPRRAQSVTQRVLDDDPAFRARVAERAEEDQLGRAGYLWLTRPDGWEGEYARLSTSASETEPETSAIPGATSAPTRLDTDGSPDLPNRRDVPEAPEPPKTDSSVGAVVSDEPMAAPAADSNASGSVEVPSDTELSQARSSIGDELDNLRLLVDRLADERHLVTSSYSELETEVQARRAESESMSNDLVDAKTIAARARTEAESAQSELAIAREQASAASEQAAAARRDIETVAQEREDLRAELISLRAELESARSEAAAAAASSDEQRAKQEANTADLVAARDQLQTDNEVLTVEIDALTNDLNSLKSNLDSVKGSEGELASKLSAAEGEMATLRSDLDTSRTQTDEAIAERDAALVDSSTLRDERDALVARLQVAEQARVDLEAQLDDVSRQWQSVKIELTELADQRSALSAEIERLAEARAETASARQDLLTSLAAQLGKAEAERDQLVKSLSETTERLASTRTKVESSQREVLDQLGAVGDAVADADRAAAQLTETVDVVGSDLDRLDADADADADADDAASGAASTDAVGDASMTRTDGASPDGASPDGAFEVDPLQWIDDDTVADDTVADVTVAEGAAVQTPDVEALDQAAAIGTSEPNAGDPFETNAEGAEDLLGAVLGEAPDDASSLFDAPITDQDNTNDGDTNDGDTNDGDTNDGGAREVSEASAGPDDAGEEHTFAEPNDSVDAALEAADASQASAEVDMLSDLERSLAAMGMGAQDDTFVPPNVTPDGPPLAGAARLSEARLEDLRAPIHVPPHITDDKEIAEIITGTHNVVVLVHGDHVAEMGWPGLSVAERRSALVLYLGDLTAEVGAAADVIFDGTIGGDEQLPDSKAVRIRLTAEAVTAASILPDVVDGYPRQWPVAVVTNDEDLRRKVEDRGASVMSNSQLLDLFT